MSKALLNPEGYKYNFFYDYQMALGGMWWNQLAMKFGSNNDLERYRWLGAAPSMRQWTGGRQAAQLRGNGYTIVNEPFEATIELQKEDFRRDKEDQVARRIGDLARKAAEHPNKLISDLIGLGESELCYDGKPFFADDHEEGESGVQSNLVDSGDYGGFDVTTPSEPTPDDMAKVLLWMVNHFWSYLDDKGDPMLGQSMDFVVMAPVHGTLLSSAIQAISQNTLDTGSGVRDNPLIGQNFRLGYIPNPRLDWTASIAMFVRDSSVSPFILQEEMPVDADMQADGSQEAFMNRRYLFGTEWNGNAGYGFWQLGMKGTFS